MTGESERMCSQERKVGQLIQPRGSQERRQLRRGQFGWVGFQLVQTGGISGGLAGADMGRAGEGPAQTWRNLGEGGV